MRGVSTDGQSVEAHVHQLRAAGAGKVSREVASGAKTDRAQLRRVLAVLGPGDVVTVTRLDRLALDPRPIEHARGDHRGEASRLPLARRCIGRHADRARPFDADRPRRAGGILARDLIRTRTGEGRKRAMRRGVKIGRPPKLTQTSGAKRSSGEETRTEIARVMCIQVRFHG